MELETISEVVAETQYFLPKRYKRQGRGVKRGNRAQQSSKTVEEVPVYANVEPKLNTKWTCGTCENVDTIWTIKPYKSINDVRTLCESLNMTLLRDDYELVSQNPGKQLFFVKTINGQYIEPEYKAVCQSVGCKKFSELRFYMPMKEQIQKIIYYILCDFLEDSSKIKSELADVVALMVKPHKAISQVSLWITTGSSVEPLKKFLMDNLGFKDKVKSNGKLIDVVSIVQRNASS